LEIAQVILKKKQAKLGLEELLLITFDFI